MSEPPRQPEATATSDISSDRKILKAESKGAGASSAAGVDEARALGQTPAASGQKAFASTVEDEKANLAKAKSLLEKLEGAARDETELQ